MTDATLHLMLVAIHVGSLLFRWHENSTQEWEDFIWEMTKD